MANNIVAPPPTWADVIIEDPVTHKSQFNPVWLDWFIRLAASLNGTGGAVPAHNSLSGLQGGASGDYYHLTNAQRTYTLGSYTTVPAAITVTASPFTYTNASGFNASVIVNGGTVTIIAIKRGAVSTVTGEIAGEFDLSPGDQLVVTYAVAPTMTSILR